MVGITPFLQLPSLNGVAALCQNNDSDRMNARASINIGFLTTMIVQFTYGCFFDCQEKQSMLALSSSPGFVSGEVMLNTELPTSTNASAEYPLCTYLSVDRNRKWTCIWIDL